MTVSMSHLQVTPDAHILLTDYKKEVRMLPIDKLWDMIVKEGMDKEPQSEELDAPGIG